MDKIKQAIIKIKVGDDEGFEYIYNEYHNILYSIIKSSIKNQDDAEDCLQEVFYKIFISINKFNDKLSSFKTWIITITNNCIIDMLRKNRNEEIMTSLNVDMIEAEDKTINYTVYSYFASLLGDKEYHLLLLRYGFNYSINEIAKELNVSPSAIRHHLKLIKEKLNKMIKDNIL